ncbi:uncharacterized protein [Amphiura filiformis]|uniref:uncharacterized protein n=1 Tax=Amphiura filiformis TaxID=82378 RepID=UPI003B2288E9
MAVNFLLNSLHQTFSGFTNSVIYENAMWKIIPKLKSTTIAINPEVYDQLMYELYARYGSPDDRGTKGHIYRCNMPNDSNFSTITITCYANTHNISVQGHLHEQWVENVLPEIQLSLATEHAEDSFIHNSSVCVQPTTSTPHSQCTAATSSMPCFELTFDQVINTTRDIATQTDQICEQVQTDHIPTCVSVGTQTQTPRPAPRTAPTPAPRTAPKPAPRLAPKPASMSAPEPAPRPAQGLNLSYPSEMGLPKDPVVPDQVPESDSSTTVTHIPMIPTSNYFSVLDVEETSTVHDTTDEEFPPIPLPWKAAPKPSPKPVTCTSSSATKASPTLTAPKPARNGFSTPKRTVIIIGDSIPKFIQGRRMSRTERVINRCMPGSDLAYWNKFGPLYIEHDSPDIIIMHLGTNDTKQLSPIQCVNRIRQLAKTMVNVSAKPLQVVISGITTQRHPDQQRWIKEYNTRMSEICEQLGWQFIKNDNILSFHLGDDGLHLNRIGTTILAKNFISMIQSLRYIVLEDFQMETNKTVK